MVELKLRDGAVVVEHRGMPYDVLDRRRIGFKPEGLVRAGRHWYLWGEGKAARIEVFEEDGPFRLDIVSLKLPFAVERVVPFKASPAALGRDKVGILSKGVVVDVGRVKGTAEKGGRGVVVGEKLILVFGDDVKGISAERVGGIEVEEVEWEDRGGKAVVVIKGKGKEVAIGLEGEKEGHFGFREDKKASFQRFKE